MIYLRPSRKTKTRESDILSLGQSYLSTIRDYSGLAQLATLEVDNARFRFIIESSNGLELSNNIKETLLTAHLFARGGEELTEHVSTLSPIWEVKVGNNWEQVAKGWNYKTIDRKEYLSVYRVRTTELGILSALGEEIDREDIRARLQKISVQKEVRIISSFILFSHIPSTEQIGKWLKADSAFKASVKGDRGETGAAGKSVTVSEVTTALKADSAFKASVKGDRGDRGLQGPQGLLEFNYYTEEEGSGVIASANSTPSVLHIVLNGWSGEARMPRLSTTALGTVVYVSYSSHFILQCPAGEAIPKLFFFNGEKPYDATFYPIPVSTYNGMLRMDLISARDCKGFYSFIATSKIREDGLGIEKCWVLINSSSVRNSVGVERLDGHIEYLYQQFRNYKQQTDSYITSISADYQSLLQKFNELKNKTLVKGGGLQLGFYNLGQHNSGTYDVKVSDYHILAKRTANGDNYPYIRVGKNLPNGFEFIVDVPFDGCRVRFVTPTNSSLWGNGGTEWQSGYRYHVTKSHTNEWGVIKTPYAQ